MSAATTTKTIRVLLADDHAILRAGLKGLLTDEADLEVVGEATNGAEAVQLAKEVGPDVLVLDVSMPEMTGLQAARQLQGEAVRIVILTVHELEEYVYEALRAGVAGYVLKDAAVAELVDAIRVVHAGGTYLSPAVARLVVQHGDPPGSVTTISQKLTRREREVCQLLAKGATVPEIADLIGISRKTVDVHKTRLMKKLDIHNRADLVTYALKNRLVGP